MYECVMSFSWVLEYHCHSYNTLLHTEDKYIFYCAIYGRRYLWNAGIEYIMYPSVIIQAHKFIVSQLLYGEVCP